MRKTVRYEAHLDDYGLITIYLSRQFYNGKSDVFYLKKPERKIRDIFIISEPVRYEKAGYKRGRDYFAYVRKIRSLRAPLFLDDIKTHPVLQTAGFIRSNLRKRSEVTDYWPYLFDMIVHRNPAIKNVLNKYAPGRLVSF